MTTKTPLESYRSIVDELRDMRRLPGWYASLDRDLLTRLDGLYDLLSPAERDLVEQESWRSWPDLFDKQTAA